MEELKADTNSGVSHRHADGEVRSAESMEAAQRICPALGRVGLEKAGLLFELEALGNTLLAEKSETNLLESPDTDVKEPASPVEPIVLSKDLFSGVREETKINQIAKPEVVEKIETVEVTQERADIAETKAPEVVVSGAESSPVHEKATTDSEKPASTEELIVEKSAPEVLPEITKKKEPEFVAAKNEESPQNNAPPIVKDIEITEPTTQPESHTVLPIIEKPVAKQELKAAAVDSSNVESKIEEKITESEPALDLRTRKVQEAVANQNPEIVPQKAEAIPPIIEEKIKALNQVAETIESAPSTDKHEVFNRVVSTLEAIEAHIAAGTIEPKQAEVEITTVVEDLFEAVGIEYSAEEIGKITAALLDTETTHPKVVLEEDDFNYALSDYGTHEGMLQFIAAVKRLSNLTSPIHTMLGKFVLFTSKLHVRETFEPSAALQ